MYTLTCTLTFPDGRRVVGQIFASSREGHSPITYSGAVDLLPRTHGLGSATDLKALFKNLARETGAELSLEAVGQFDTWAD